MCFFGNYNNNTIKSDQQTNDEWVKEIRKYCIYIIYVGVCSVFMIEFVRDLNLGKTLLAHTHNIILCFFW